MKNIKKVVLALMISFSACVGEGEVEAKDKKKDNNMEDKKISEQKEDQLNKSYAYFSSGCFWGTEYWFEKASGVYKVISGYSGGHKDNPTYREVSTGLTGHLETVEVVYDSSKTTYEELVKLFFETHNFSQENGQGPDIGEQYLSAIFYQNENEKNIAEKYIKTLEAKGFKVATTLRVFKKFYPAEDYHQDYYAKKGGSPYCHLYKKIF